MHNSHCADCAKCCVGGFTIIELVVVITIIGVVGAIAIPNFARTVRSDAQRAVVEVVAGYRMARALAVDRGATTALTMDLRSGEFWIVSESTPSAAGDTLRRGRVDLRGTRVSSHDRGGELAVVRFDPFGMGGGDRITLSDGKERYDVVVDTWTGAIRAASR